MNDHVFGQCVKCGCVLLNPHYCDVLTEEMRRSLLEQAERIIERLGADNPLPTITRPAPPMPKCKPPRAPD